MRAEADRQVAREFHHCLEDIVPVLDQRVFGSLARGDAALEPDLDLLIELEESTRALRDRISEIAWELGFEMDRVVSTLVTTRAELEHGAMGARPLILYVQREGVRP